MVPQRQSLVAPGRQATTKASQALSNRRVSLVRYVGTLPCGSRHGRHVRNVLHLPPSVSANKHRLVGERLNALWLHRRSHQAAPTSRRTCPATGAGGPTPPTASDARCKRVASWLRRQLTVQRSFTWGLTPTAPTSSRALVSSTSTQPRRPRTTRERASRWKTSGRSPLSRSHARPPPTISSSGTEPKRWLMRWQR